VISVLIFMLSPILPQDYDFTLDGTGGVMFWDCPSGYV